MLAGFERGYEEVWEGLHGMPEDEEGWACGISDGGDACA